jgi:methionine-rich copper-binding protein CopC
MSVENIIEELDNSSDGGLKKTRVRKARRVAESADPSPQVRKKLPLPDLKLFVLIIVFIGIVGLVGLVFGYTKDKVTEVKTSGANLTRGLESQLNNLKTELNTLRDKTTVLERENSANKDLMLDLFEQSRKLSSGVNAIDWNLLQDDTLGFTVKHPMAWERVQSITDKKPAAGTVDEEKADAVPEEVFVYLQPKNDSNFLNAVLIKTDYPEYFSKSLKDKEAAFASLELLDKQDFNDGKMLYFVNIDKNNVQVPTIIVLTKDKIYRATFNISNKKLDKYIDYRKSFEDIVSTFELK